MRTGFFLILAVIILSEFYFIQATRTATQDLSPVKKNIAMYFVYGLLCIDLLFVIISVMYPPPNWSDTFRMVLSILFILMLCKVFCLLFLLPEDLVRGVRLIIAKIRESSTEQVQDAGKGISRAKFLSQTAIVFTIIPFAGLIYGVVSGAYKYRVHKVKVPAPNLPEAFDGFKIVQLSDIHVGSFMSGDPLNKAFDIVMQQKPDLILFTGDLVNNIADETAGYEETFRRLKAPYGVYSVLGNHDYGDYVDWESTQKKRDNLDKLKKLQASFGWRLLMNEHVPLEKNGQQIALLGIENWGGSLRFPRYGKLDQAYKGAENYPYKILMSHDPSHWDKQVRPEYGNIDLTLSGHTHGMQLGIEIPGIKWSPAKWVYKEWAGLYREGKQFLYVNRGLGFLGYPGRLGIWPEITVIELQKV